MNQIKKYPWSKIEIMKIPFFSQIGLENFLDFFKIRTLCWGAIVLKLKKYDLKFVQKKIFRLPF